MFHRNDRKYSGFEFLLQLDSYQDLVSFENWLRDKKPKKLRIYNESLILNDSLFEYVLGISEYYGMESIVFNFL